MNVLLCYATNVELSDLISGRSSQQMALAAITRDVSNNELSAPSVVQLWHKKENMYKGLKWHVCISL